LLGLVVFSAAFVLLKPLLHKWLINPEKNVLFKPYFRLVLPLVWSMVLFNVLEAFCIHKLRISVTSFIKELIIRVLILVILLLFYFKFISYDFFIYCFVGVYFVALLLLIAYVLYMKYPIQYSFVNFKAMIVKDHFSYIGYIYLSIICIGIITYFGNVMVGTYLGDAQIALYTLGINMATMIQIPYRSVSQITSPLFAEAWHNKDLDRIKKMNTEAGLNIMFFGTLLFMLLVININNVIDLLPLKYQLVHGNLYAVVLWVAVGKLFDMSTGLNSEILFTSPYYRFNLILVLVLAVFTIALNAWLIPTYGLLGAAMASAFTVFVFNATKFLFLYFKFGLQPYSLNGLYLLLLMLFLIAANYFSPSLSHWFFDALVRSFLSGFIFIFSALKLNLAPDVTELCKKIPLLKNMLP
jgi:O-antigen/teichoic acid export membrane protein